MNELDVQAVAGKLMDNINHVIVGKEKQVELVVTALFSGGHVLLEDVPGSGKTMLAKSLAKSINGEFKRIQFTPDLMPGDITGINWFNVKKSEFEFMRGPIFSNVLLADEINRATPKTQSGLLECMEEKQVTIDGKTYVLDSPFFVIATENPIDIQGVFPLPEAQLDRFLIKLSLGYPDTNAAFNILKNHVSHEPLADIKAVVTKDELLSVAVFVEEIEIHDDLLKYVVALTEATRSMDGVLLGISQRGSIALVRFAMAHAALCGRKYVIPDDIKMGVVPVFSHRIILSTTERLHNKIEDKLQEILNEIPVPTEYQKVRRV